MVAFKKRKYNDLGLDTKARVRFRALNKDGTFNVKKINVPFFERTNYFHSLVTMPWRHFFGLVILCYFVVNLLFASIYMAVGVENLTATEGLTTFEKFMEAFFFSAQTITTLGYGRVAPVGILANSIAALESLLGLLSFALATGMLYGRFSKPSGKIRYSSIALIAPYQDINGFMFRVVNPQSNQLLEVEVTISLSLSNKHSDKRDFYLLDLERPKVVFFPTMWTIVHPITQNSPLYGLSEADVLEREAEFIITIRAFDESFSQTVYSRASYNAYDLKWGAKFVYLIKSDPEKLVVDVGRIDETEAAALNT